MNYVLCVKADNDRRFLRGKYYWVVSLNNGVNVIDESGELATLYTYGDKFHPLNDHGETIETTAFIHDQKCDGELSLHENLWELSAITETPIGAQIEAALNQYVETEKEKLYLSLLRKRGEQNANRYL